MIVELVGCSGAGKSAMMRGALALVASSGMVPGSIVPMPDVVLRRFHLGRVSNAQVVNLIEDVAGAPKLVRSWPVNGEFVKESLSHVWGQRTSLGRRVLDVRSIARRTGMFEWARRAGGRRVLIFDEGPLQSAYHLFGYDERPFTSVCLERFVELVPLPDAVVHVTAPVADLVERAQHRVDPRRQLRNRPKEDVERRLAKAVRLFDTLVSVPALSPRVVTIDNGTSEGGFEAATRRLADHLLGWADAGHRPLAAAHSTNERP